MMMMIIIIIIIKGKRRKLTLFFNFNGTQDEGRRLQTKTMTSQGSRVNKIVKVINHLCVLNSCLDTRFVPALKLWMLHNCKDITNKRLEIKSRKKKKKEELTKNNRKDNTPRLGALYQ